MAMTYLELMFVVALGLLASLLLFTLLAERKGRKASDRHRTH